MTISAIIAWLIIGLVVGGLAHLLVPGRQRIGILLTLLFGIVGALIASWLFPRLGIHLGTGIVSRIIWATIGAIILLLILRLVRGRGRW